MNEFQGETVGIEAYSRRDRVVNVVHSLGIARKVARVVPLGVIKG